VFRSGDQYEGTFKDDLLDGTGRFVYANGEALEGEWEKAFVHDYDDEDEDDGEFELDAPDETPTKTVKRQTESMRIMNQTFRSTTSTKAVKLEDVDPEVTSESGTPPLERRSSMKKKSSFDNGDASSPSSPKSPAERRVSFKEELDFAPPVYKSGGCCIIA
jgi:hypothetical protein